MDKLKVLRSSLNEIMADYKDQIDSLVGCHNPIKVIQKFDNTPVTALDLALSDLVESIAKKELAGETTFYSEEKFDLWKFPLLALDPLDGTREYIANRPEWAISLGLFNSERFEGEGWVYNPKTRECFTMNSTVNFRIKNNYLGEVSRSEWESDLFKNKGNEKFVVKPMGSIAYKLGKLSAGKMDFVVSLRPKNIWDVAGGTLLCQKAGLKFFAEGKEVTKVLKNYQPPLIWCHEKLFPELSKLFS